MKQKYAHANSDKTWRILLVWLWIFFAQLYILATIIFRDASVNGFYVREGYVVDLQNICLFRYNSFEKGTHGLLQVQKSIPHDLLGDFRKIKLFSSEPMIYDALDAKNANEQSNLGDLCKTQLSKINIDQINELKDVNVGVDDGDFARPTENGGYSHTKSSRAKISAANKGKVPWNKGKSRSEEVKARIAEGVRKKNRERFLKKLEDMGLTEEEYELKKKEERRMKEAERRARRTANGGYTPTDATKRKISMILKEKHARGEIKPRAKIDPSKIRRGFTHSEETRKKISESLRKKWSQDENYRTTMKASHATRKDVRGKISETLKKKWRDPEYRASMMAKMANARSENKRSHRQKISEAIKRKWQDASYREKTISSIKQAAKFRISIAPSKPAAKKVSQRKKEKPREQKAKKKEEQKLETIQLMPLNVGESRKTTKETRVVRRRKTSTTIKTNNATAAISLEAVSPSKLKPESKQSNSAAFSKPRKVTVKKKKTKQKVGSVNRLREERRDLFDLLYGDEDNDAFDEDKNEEEFLSQASAPKVGAFLGDEDLDNFDPYGLDDY